jgi:hypothetical protein
MDNNKKSNTVNPVTVSKKVKRTRSLPVKYMGVANLGKDAAILWRDNHSNFSFSLLDYQTLEIEADKLLALVADNNNNISDKKNNTQTLAANNKAITEAANVLKKMITAEYARVKDKSAYFLAYGFVKSATGQFKFPVDNNQRKAALLVLTNKMQEAGNVFANRDIGLRGWLTLMSEHDANWRDSTLIRSERSDSSKDAAEQYEKVHQMLYILFHYLGLAFINEDVAKIRRSFGFLKESF